MKGRSSWSSVLKFYTRIENGDYDMLLLTVSLKYMYVCKFQYLALMLRSGYNKEHLLHRWRQLDAAARADVHVDEDFEARRSFLANVDTMSLYDEAAAATEEIDFH